MKKITAGFIALVLGLFCSPAAFAGEGWFTDSGFSAGGDLSYYTQYVWRGFVLDRDNVLQPGYYISTPDTKYGKLTGKVWSSHDTQNQDNLKSEENDYILDYTYTLGDIGLSIGHTYYDFVDTDTFSREWYTGVSLPEVFLSPSLFFYRDYGSEDDGGGFGTYTVLNLAKSIPVELKGVPSSLELSGHYGYNHKLFMAGKGADIGMTVGFKTQLTKNLSVMPNINYSIPLGDLKAEEYGDQKKRFYTGVVAAYAF
ncbi:MAG: hypothetical protein PHH68_04370 [Candidatus Omnitrophica bacterium]|jgi:hypothetical protein|nr:hypothetical protein [Candidatus Omnitrophota bacterium]MDD5079544.1 hypothetical protein [Candidatus Omnitrophota bacterium]